MNAFLASGSRVKKNFKALLMKATKSLGGGARRGILSSINENLDGSHNVVARDPSAWMQPA